MPSTPTPDYAELHCISNFSFLRGASRPEELVDAAATLGYTALAITDECSMAGMVRAHARAKELGFKLIVGSEFALDDGYRLIVLVRDADCYTALCQLISQARRAAEKGSYDINRTMIERAGLEGCCLILAPPYYGAASAAITSVNTETPTDTKSNTSTAKASPTKAPPTSAATTTAPRPDKALPAWLSWFKQLGPHTYLALELHYGLYDQKHSHWVIDAADQFNMAVVACGDVHMHRRKRRALQDVLTCIRHNCTLETAGRRLFANGERYLRDSQALQAIYPWQAIQNAADVAAMCTFSMDQLNYQYPREVVPDNHTAQSYLRELAFDGAKWRWPEGVKQSVTDQIEYELDLISHMQYESYFLTVYDIVKFARSQFILCQGRGSAANSAVCYCLGITEVDPARTSMLFERFISKERNEPPDIDVDFEHERREEVIQYIYNKYGRHRAALAATVVCYRKRSAIRDIGKVVGMAEEQIEALSKSLAWWDGAEVIGERLQEMGFDPDSPLLIRFAWLLEQLLGFPRHLSQHVGGFIISDQNLASLVPIENAAMADRTIIQWDKDDLEELGLLKVDILALGMLTAISKCFTLIKDFRGVQHSMASIPPDDTPTYDMICKADTIGVFQIESRAQMSMLPRLRPRNYYDLVIEVAIVRPGPIQGGMVNPYLQRRQGKMAVTYPSPELERVLSRTLGVPVFQEQVMEIAMVAAGFTAGQADQLRRSMAAWRRVGAVTRFRDELINGMLAKGYEPEFAEAIFRQIEGFGEYGFPESHAASFALLVYVSCYLKCHEPAAFLCAMLNSQPLGFYDASDLTQDAQRHNVTVLPVDINLSDWDHKLVPDKNNEPAVRLGLRIVARLSRNGGEQVLNARQSGEFVDAADLTRRSGVHQGDQQALAIAGALKNIAGNRHQAQWDLLGIEQLPGLLDEASANEPYQQLPLPSEGENIVADFLSTGLTLGRHPLSLLRSRLDNERIVDSNSWLAIPNGRPARMAGIIKVRQRPGSASGVLFMTLEDEYGPFNVIVWPKIVDQFRKEVLGAKMVSVEGMTQREGDVSHLVARKITDLSWMLGELTTHSRNFH